MSAELLYFLVMIITFVFSAMVWKQPIGISLILSSIAGVLVAGEGIPIRHLVEGTFAYLDPILIIATALIFMESLRRSGALGTISTFIISRMHDKPIWLIILITIFIMFPGMITGLSTATVLTTGALVAPAMMLLGMPRVTVAAIIAMTAIYGMIAPPINVPAMIIGGGVDMPYIGFEIPLLFATIPLAFGVNLALGFKYVRNVNIEEIRPKLDENLFPKYGWTLYFPLFIVVFLLIGVRIFPEILPNFGVPLIFMVGSIAAMFTGENSNYFKLSHAAIKEALPVLGILIGIGMFIQIMTLNGVRGMLVISSLSMPSFWKYLSMGVMIPLFGAVSAYGSASVLGVPFLLSFLGQNEVVVGSALSLLTGLGDLMPPTALAGIFAAQVVGEKNYFKVLKITLLPAFFTIAWALIMIYFANELGKFI